MNWATIAPETRLYKGKSLYKWEDSPGLEHHCGTCATPLHNSRAKTTCIGKHVEPCYRFHQQLHFVGKSHECFGCNSSDEMHHNRHKEILKLVRQIISIDEETSLKPTRRAISSIKSHQVSPSTSSDTANDTANDTCNDTASEAGTEIAASEIGMEDMKITRRERKRAKKNGTMTSKARLDVEAFPVEETDLISAALHGKVHESKGAWEGTYVYDHNAPNFEMSDLMEEEAEGEFQALNTPIDDLAVKYELVAKMQPDLTARQRKTLKLDTVPSSTDLSVKEPTELTPRQRRTLKKFSTPINYSSYGNGSRKFSLGAAAQKFDLFDGVDPAIFARLKIEPVHPVKNVKSRRELVIKLIAAIKEDLEIIDRENKEMIIRGEGFWRWAGKAAFYAIKETRETLDWATGMKIDEKWEKAAGFIDPATGMNYYEDEDETVITEPEPMEVDAPAKKGNTLKKGTTKGRTSSEWETVVSKRTDTTKKKPPRLTKTLRPPEPATNHSNDTKDEEGDDVDDMVQRYQQRVAGTRNVGSFNQGSVADGRLGGRMLAPPRTPGRILRLS